MEIKKLYESLLQEGDLFIFLPAAKGNWKEDKKIFCEYYEQNQAYINDIEITDLEDYSE